MTATRVSRRRFLRCSFAVGVACSGINLTGAPIAERPLAGRFPDLARHFVFEYYPWYGMHPVQHWNQDGRQPPADLATNYVPRLGAYDSGSVRVLEQHARWMKSTGVGAMNASWWGPGSDTDRLMPLLMDVMADYDIRVTFHIEPYHDRHADTYAEDVTYLIRNYGEARGWDSLLMLTNEDGSSGPVFKSFRTILPDTQTDCRGRTSPVQDYAADAVWRRQTDRVRDTFSRDFDHVTLLADSLDVARTQACGFDGIAIYDNYVSPRTWRQHAVNCTARGLLFSFSINPGFDGVAIPHPNPGSCYRPLPFEPGSAKYDWSKSRDRDRASRESTRRITESFKTTVAVQSDERWSNAKRGFFLSYVTSFNEWHEGHQFEPMKNAADLTPDEQARRYHNPTDGQYRLKILRQLLAPLLLSR